MADSPFSIRWPNASRLRSRARSSKRIAESESASKPLDDETLMAVAQAFDSDTGLFRNAGLEGTCIHAVNGVELVTDFEGTAYWPACDTLLVADLHLEKGASFARRGQLLPPYDTRTTLRRLATCIERWQPDRVIALGDSFHDNEASRRLDEESRSLLSGMVQARNWLWIAGNHDPDPPEGIGGTTAEYLREGGLILRHQPSLDDAIGEVAGHLHPKARLVRRGRTVRRSCFAASRIRMILPSFGAYTGGLNVFDPAFDGLFPGHEFHAIMRGDGQVYRISAEDLC